MDTVTQVSLQPGLSRHQSDQSRKTRRGALTPATGATGSHIMTWFKGEVCRFSTISSVEHISAV